MINKYLNTETISSYGWTSQNMIHEKCFLEAIQIKCTKAALSSCLFAEPVSCLWKAAQPGDGQPAEGPRGEGGLQGLPGLVRRPPQAHQATEGLLCRKRPGQVQQIVYSLNRAFNSYSSGFSSRSCTTSSSPSVATWRGESLLPES